MERTGAGLDIGGDTVRAVRLGWHGDTLVLKGAQVFPGGTASRKGLLRQARTVIPPQAAATPSDPAFSMRLLDLPAAAADVTKTAITTELAMDPDGMEVVFDWTRISMGAAGKATSGGEGGASTRVLVTSAPRGEFEDFLAELEGEGFRPSAVEGRASALCRAFLETGDVRAGEPVCIMELGIGGTHLALMVDRRIHFIRMPPIHGKALAAAVGMNAAKDEGAGASKGVNLYDALPDDASEAAAALELTKYVESLITEIRLALDFCNLHLSCLRDVGAVSRIHIAGELAGIDGLARFLSLHLGLRVHLFNPFEKLAVDTGTVLPQDGWGYAVAVGLALRHAGVDDGAGDLLRRYRAQVKEEMRPVRQARWVAALFLLAGIGYFVHATRVRAEMDRVMAEEGVTDAEWNALTATRDHLKEAIAEREARLARDEVQVERLAREISVQAGVLQAAERDRVSGQLAAILAAVPDGGVLREIRFDGEHVFLHGGGLSAGGAHGFVTGLRAAGMDAELAGLETLVHEGEARLFFRVKVAKAPGSGVDGGAR